MIYFDNAATTQMSNVAIDALINISKDFYGNPSASYSIGRLAKKLIDEARIIIADCIGALPEEIIFTSCGTESDNMAIAQCINNKVDAIITTKIEHHAVLNPVKKCEDEGIDVKYLTVNNGGLVELKELEKVLFQKKVLASIMYQNNETGVIQPIKELARLIHNDNEESLVHTDAVQAVGHCRIDVKNLGVDMLSASAHKFNGPKGVGFLYANKGIKTSAFILGGGQEKGLRSGTENVAEIYAMAKALEENVKNIEKNGAYISNLEKLFFEELNRYGVKFLLNGDNDNRANGIINISIQNIDGEGLLNMLDTHDICISIGSACNSKSKEHSYVLKEMKLDEDRIESAVRISIGRFNTEEDIRELVKRITAFYELTNAIL